MAEKQNCSDMGRINTSAMKRRASMPALSRILKSQTSSFRHRASPSLKTKSSGGFKMFLVKSLIGFGAIYLTAFLGVWGEAEESSKIMSKIKRTLTRVENENIFSENMKTDLVDKVNKSKDFIVGNLGSIPEELKAYYDKSEKCIKDLVKGKST